MEFFWRITTQPQPILKLFLHYLLKNYWGNVLNWGERQFIFLMENTFLVMNTCIFTNWIIERYLVAQFIFLELCVNSLAYLKVVHRHIQGHPSGFDIKYRPGLTRCFYKSTKNWCSVASWVVEIYAWSTISNFFDLMRPQRPPSEMVPYNSGKLDFWWSIPQNITSIDYFGASDDQTIMIRKFFGEIGL